MAFLADEILATALSEITLRDPSYFDRQAVGFASVPQLAQRYAAQPLFSGFAAAEIERRLSLAIDSALASGVRRSEDPQAQSRLAALICDSAMDGLAAEAGLISLRAPRAAAPLPQVLAEDYAAKSVDDVNYLARRSGERWLLVINALGIPLGVWSRLLSDPENDYRILVVETAGSDLVHGGIQTEVDLATDVARIARALDAEKVEAIDVVGWCSGGRVAVQLAAEQGDRVRSLALTSTTLRGVAGSAVGPTQFEEDISGVFASVARSPASADFLAEVLVNSAKLAPPLNDDALLFRQPAQQHAAALTTPMTTGEDLKRYCRRIAADKAHFTADALARVKAPILALAGSHDHVVNNDHTWSTLQAHAGNLQSAVISGAGHYAYDLQYPWFRLVLDAFTGGRPFASARIGSLATPG
jgi:pimeloyl-ACP methyl ester carboxylesterase